MTNKEAKATKIGVASESQIREVIGLQLMKLGIDGGSIPDQVKMLIIGWLRKHWGWVTLFQFSNAFNMAITGKLQVDAQCYGKFTIEYIGRIMGAWYDYAKGSEEVQKQYDAVRQYRHKEIDRNNVTPMGDLVSQWVAELNAKKLFR